MTKAQGRRKKKLEGYYKRFAEKLTKKKNERKIKRAKRLEEIKEGKNLGSPAAQRRRRYYTGR